VDNARQQGTLLLGELQKLAQEFPAVISNPRGLGLMCAFDTPDSNSRDRLLKALLQEKLLMVGCGEKGIRFRPHLTVSADEIRQGLDIIRRVLKKGTYLGLDIWPEPCMGLGT
ncbi:MAG: aminotransferase class III-fold pyridoxal phosphate-dependent enzyme, partial [Deltaproteobacteria bacterium]